MEDTGMRDTLHKYRYLLGSLGIVTAGTLTGLLAAAPAVAGGFDLGDIVKKGVKIVGINTLVSKFDEDIDDAINNLLDNNRVGTGSATKVVVIVSPIGNKHIGAAQVVGPAAQVNKVRAVVQLETSFHDKMFRIKALVPADSQDPGNFDRVEGVGISAIVDVKI
jgi:hypothetical protein